eukprot:CAMPEP_0197884368 /NCGR_PEP_ID=MMETSP1439-20131203/10844_1 /TAXON_ID=66791 /ORGANISM="Gonyaulax spinifera, Strain CCMP409" /LENGTH=208 /DNA_ID=CAMNT_0043504097 /DNA_START=104 /DNA_END=730 /DNA_ORIENTATION=+
MAMRAIPLTSATVVPPAWQPSPLPTRAAVTVAAPQARSSWTSFRGTAATGACWLTAIACAVTRRSRAATQQRAVKEAKAATEAKAAKPKAKAKAKPKAKAKAKKAPPLPLSEQAGEGIFAPLVLAGHATVGEPFVTKARGKGIGLHSKAITAFCERFAIPNKKRQGFIKTAKVTGHDLGFLIPGGHFGDGLFGGLAMDFWNWAGIDKW